MTQRPTDETGRDWQRYAVPAAAIIIALILGVVVFRTAWRMVGPVATIFYLVLYVLGVGFMPGIILFGAPSFPSILRRVFGKGEWVLASVAYNVPFLVQRRTNWELDLGRETDDGYEVYIDGAWHPVDGDSNMTVLGWQPFGILRYKDDRAFVDERADARAQDLREETAVSVADGGTTGPAERGGMREATQPAITGLDGQWLVDLKRVYSRGVKRIGDIALIEKAEEVTRRKQAGSDTLEGWEPIIGSLVGLVLGLVTGYVMLGG